MGGERRKGVQEFTEAKLGMSCEKQPLAGHETASSLRLPPPPPPPPCSYVCV